MLQRKKNKVSFGKKGEDFACSLLKKQGYIVLTKNYRTKFGEIDIIAIDNDTLVFVEVKTRRSTKHGLPEEAVDERKLNKIRKVGEHFIQNNQNVPRKQRVDVISLIIVNGNVIRAKVIQVT